MSEEINRAAIIKELSNDILKREQERAAAKRTALRNIIDNLADLRISQQQLAQNITTFAEQYGETKKELNQLFGLTQAEQNFIYPATPRKRKTTLPPIPVQYDQQHDM